MLKVLRKISKHSVNQDDTTERTIQKCEKNVDKLRTPNSARIPLNPRKKEMLQKPNKYDKMYSNHLAGMEPSIPRMTRGSSAGSGSTEQIESYSMQPAFGNHEDLVNQNKINRKRSEEYYIYDFEKYTGPTDDFTTCDADYDVLQVVDGINPKSARYVIHYLTKAFKDQLSLRFSHDNTNIETNVIKLSMEIFKPNLSHYSNSEISHVKKLLRSFFPWEGCSITGRLMTKAIEENYGDLRSEKHWHRLILTLRELWSRLSCGIIPWKSYTDFCKLEKERNYPKMSFYSLLPQCLPTHEYACCSFEFLEILLAIISKIDLVVDKNAQLDLIFTAGQVCFMKDYHLTSFIREQSKNDPNLLMLGKLYYERGNAMLYLFVCYLRSLAEEGKINDFYLLDNFHIDQYPPQPYKPLTQTALTLTIPSFEVAADKNDFNTLLKRTSKAQSRIYSSNHTFSKIENSFLDKFEEDPYKVYDSIFSKSSKRYLHKFDKDFDPRRLRFLNANEVQDGLTNLDVNDQYAVATWIDHIKDQDFNDFLNVLEDSNYGDGTLAFDYSSFSKELRKNPSKEKFSPVRLSKMPISEWFISSWKYETFLGKVRNTLVFKLTKKIGECDWLIISTDERVGTECYLTPPASSDSAKRNEHQKKVPAELDNFSIKSRPPPPHLLGDKSSSPFMETSSSISSIYSGASKKPFRELETPESIQTNSFIRKTKMDVITQLPTYPELMTPINQGPITPSETPIQPQKEFVPAVLSKISNPSLLNVVEKNAHPYSAGVPSITKQHEKNETKRSQLEVADSKIFTKPLDFGDKVKAVVQEPPSSTKKENLHSNVEIDREGNEKSSLVSIHSTVKESVDFNAIPNSKEKDLNSITLFCPKFDAHVEVTQKFEQEKSNDADENSINRDDDDDDDDANNNNNTNNTTQSNSNNNDNIKDNVDDDRECIETAVLFRKTSNESDKSGGRQLPNSEEIVNEASLVESTDDSIPFQDIRSENVPLFDDIYNKKTDGTCNGVQNFGKASELLSTETESRSSNKPLAPTHSIMDSSETKSIDGRTTSEMLVVQMEDENDSQTDDRETSTQGKVNLTPNRRLERASTFMHNGESPIDILNDLIDNYNAESVAVKNSESPDGETLFAVVKHHMEKTRDISETYQPHNVMPTLKKLNTDLDSKDNKHSDLKKKSTIDSCDDAPLVTPTRGTEAMLSCFSYNATPPMKQQEFRYTKSLKSSEEKENFYEMNNNDQEIIDMNIKPSCDVEDDACEVESIEGNGGLKRVMLKTRRSFKNLRVKSSRK